jgi:sulfur-oxidizing protein SoxY
MNAMLRAQRRRLLRSSAALSLAALGLPQARAAAAPALAEVLAALAAADATTGVAIKLEAPAIAENGAVVPVELESTLPGARELLLFVDVNPQPLALRSVLPEGAQPFLAARIRMAGSGTVIAAVRTADGALHAVKRSVQVVVGGCG